MTTPEYLQTISNILVIDDDESICIFLTDIIKKKSKHQVSQAKDGQEAFQIWQETTIPYDLLIIDLKMPRMDGETLIRHIRELDQEVALIVLTGHGDLNIAFNLLQKYQISDVLNKPLHHPDTLLFTIENALEKKWLKQQLGLLQFTDGDSYTDIIMDIED